jgi:protein-arginine kinase activator protein McsA
MCEMCQSRKATILVNCEYLISSFVVRNGTAFICKSCYSNNNEIYINL